MLQPLKKSPNPPWLHKLVGDDFLGDIATVVWWGDRITDSDLANLEVFHNLRYLSLTRTKVDDTGLEHLKSLTKLQTLDLSGTKVTAQGIKKIQQALPNCQIVMK